LKAKHKVKISTNKKKTEHNQTKPKETKF
jgi:hypothetical protein